MRTDQTIKTNIDRSRLLTLPRWELEPQARRGCFPPAAWEQPQLLSAELRAAFRSLRQPI